MRRFDAAIHAEPVLSVARHSVVELSCARRRPDRPPELQGASVGMDWALDEDGAAGATAAERVVRRRAPPGRAENVRAVAIEEVEAVEYLPGDQRLLATLRAPVGRAVVSFAHSSACAGAVDTLSEALGPMRFAGHLHRHAGDVSWRRRPSSPAPRWWSPRSPLRPSR